MERITLNENGLDLLKIQHNDTYTYSVDELLHNYNPSSNLDKVKVIQIIIDKMLVNASSSS